MTDVRPDAAAISDSSPWQTAALAVAAFLVGSLSLITPAWTAESHGDGEAAPLGTEPRPTRWRAGPEAGAEAKPEIPAPQYEEGMELETVPVAPARRYATPGAPSVAAVHGRICLVVESSLYASIQAGIGQFTSDLQAAGYDVVVYQHNGGTPTDLRAYLKSLYDEPAGLVGAQLIGDIPYIVYELTQNWGYGDEFETFPCDLFYMDLDGTWADNQSTGSYQAGRYDTRGGDKSLEIWVSRLKTSNLPSIGGEAALLNTYFQKAHDFRYRNQPVTAQQVIYNDDDWANMATGDTSDLSQVWPSNAITSYSAGGTTTTTHYQSTVMTPPLEHAFVRSHGSAHGHGFYNASHQYQWISASTYQTMDPPALVYSFYVCSGSDYTASDNLAGTSVFNPECGLFAWGSTKTGGMWAQSPFYSALDQGESYGEAFRQWYNNLENHSYYTNLAPRWWYGMVLIGDATLRPTSRMRMYEVDVDLPQVLNEGTGALTNQGTVSIPWPHDQDLVVSLQSSDAALVQVPASVTIPAGSVSATFTPTVLDNDQASGQQVCTVSAGAQGWIGDTFAAAVTDDEGGAAVPIDGPGAWLALALFLSLAAWLRLQAPRPRPRAIPVPRRRHGTRS